MHQLDVFTDSAGWGLSEIREVTALPLELLQLFQSIDPTLDVTDASEIFTEPSTVADP